MNKPAWRSRDAPPPTKLRDPGNRAAYQKGFDDCMAAMSRGLAGMEQDDGGLVEYRFIEAMYAEIKAVYPSGMAYVIEAKPMNYLKAVQRLAQKVWDAAYQIDDTGRDKAVDAAINTPLGTLTARVWRRVWEGKSGTRLSWAAEFEIDGEPITIAQAREAGLADTRIKRPRKTPQNDA